MADGALNGDETYFIENELSLPELAEEISHQAMEYQEAFDASWSALPELEKLYPDPDKDLEDEDSA